MIAGGHSHGDRNKGDIGHSHNTEACIKVPALPTTTLCDAPKVEKSECCVEALEHSCDQGDEQNPGDVHSAEPPNDGGHDEDKALGSQHDQSSLCDKREDSLLPAELWKPRGRVDKFNVAFNDDIPGNTLWDGIFAQDDGGNVNVIRLQRVWCLEAMLFGAVDQILAGAGAQTSVV